MARSQNLEIFYSDNVGRWPRSKLVQGADGNFYGTTPRGGAGGYESLEQDGYGTIFRVTPAGVRITVLSFNKIQGCHPMAGLVIGADGNFYGTASGGGTANLGTVFKMTPAGALTTLASFDGQTGSLPKAALFRAGDGNFYGTCYSGGSSHCGTVFRMTPDGVLTNLASFNGPNGSYPLGGVVEGPDGSFYGTTEQGGLHDRGTVFKLTSAGVLTTLVSLDPTTGRRPRAGLTLGNDGNFYGTISDVNLPGEAAELQGSVFKVTPQGVLTTLMFFDGTNGRWPEGELLKGADGNFYGTTFWGGTIGDGAIFRITPAGVFTLLASMDGAVTGGNLQSGLMQGTDGNFYGTASAGLFYTSVPYGTIYKMTPAGALSRLALFESPNGAFPLGALAQDPAGNLYATASEGGPEGQGTILKVSPSGVASRLVSFKGPNGIYPPAGLRRGSDGNFYGTTAYGGTYTISGTPVEADGTVFKMTPSGVLTTLVAFRNSNGGRPVAGLIQGTDGAFYGTTKEGGAYNKGTIFRVTAAGAFTTLKALNFDEEVFAPSAALVQGSDGHFYGTATGGIHNWGAVFRLTSAGVMSVIHLFSASGGAYAASELLQSSDGSFYGTTRDDGFHQGGDIYRVTVSGTRTSSVEFNSSERVRGFNPGGGLVKGPDGNFYGTNEKGGAGGSGTVFRLTPTGVFTTLAAFDGLSSANPRGTPIFGADGKLYGSAGQMALWRLALPGPGTPQAVTMAPDEVGDRRATLHGTINAQGQGFVEAFFQYGTDSGLGGALEVDALTAASGSLTTPVALTVSDLLPGTLYYYRAVARSDTWQSGSILSFRTLTRLQQWRQDHFGTSANAGAAANPEDPDGDGLVNLMEFAMGSPPLLASLSTIKIVRAGNVIGITYTRSSDAVADGMIFTVQWSETFAPASWSSSGINTFVFSDNGSEQQVQAAMTSTAARRYFRLKVETP